MAKYHINPSTGNPGVCRADPSKPKARGCDFELGESDHYRSAEEARTAFEASMTDKVAPVIAKPMDMKAVRLQAKAAVPTKQSFGKITPFSWNEATDAQRELINKLSNEEQIAQGWEAETGFGGGKKWHSYFKGALAAGRREGELNAARYAAALQNDASDSRPFSEVITSESVNENSPRVKLNEAEEVTANSINRLPRTTQEMIYKQPAAFLHVLVDSPGGNSNVRALAQLSNELRMLNPNFIPTPGKTPPTRRSGRHFEGDTPQMQKMGPYGYGLLQSYVTEKFGDRSREFWKTVESDSANFPKLSDFMRAVKAFK